jgi:hypothetical protein
MTSTAAPRLRALIEQATPPAPAPARAAIERRERCELCGMSLAEVHRHVVDLAQRQLLCACRACQVLFDHDAAGGQHYRLVPDRCVRLEELRLDDLAWRSLDLPVDVAFFLRDGDTGRVTALYPSPAGCTESQLELAAWSEIESDNPSLAQMRADVEALLVNRAGGARDAFVVGIDECYRLVALVRRHWRGFGGGDVVWQELARFFERLDARAGGRT